MTRKMETLFASCVITFFLLLILFIVGESGLTSATDINFNESTNPFYTSFVISTRGPSYFFPFADISMSLTNPYAEFMSKFTVYDSLDNYTWVQVPFSNTSKSVRIGTVPLNGFDITIYQEAIFNIQNVTIRNQTIPFEKAVGSFSQTVQFSPIATPQTWVIFVLLGIAVFSFVLQIIDFLTRDDSKSHS